MHMDDPEHSKFRKYLIKQTKDFYDGIKIPI